MPSLLQIKKCVSKIFRLSYLKAKYAGKHIYKYVCDEKEKQYLIFSHGIGDVVWSLTFFETYILKNNLSDICFIVCGRDEKIVRTYFQDAKIKCLQKSEIIKIGVYAASLSSKKSNSDVIVYPRLKEFSLMSKELALFSQIGMEMDECYKYGCFDLGIEAKPRLPNLTPYENAAEKIIQDEHIEKNNTVIIVPNTNSRLRIPFEFWESVSRELNEIGINVYTNIGTPSETTIKGTKPLLTPLEELPIIAKKTGCVVSGRCGLADWLFLNECDMCILHSYKDNCENNNDLIQSSFGRKESFIAMKDRCDLKIAHLEEYRVCIDSDWTSVVRMVVDYCVNALKEKKNE